MARVAMVRHWWHPWTWWLPEREEVKKGVVLGKGRAPSNQPPPPRREWRSSWWREEPARVRPPDAPAVPPEDKFGWSPRRIPDYVPDAPRRRSSGWGTDATTQNIQF